MTDVSDQLVIDARNYISQIVDFPNSQIAGVLVNRVDIWKFGNKVRVLLMARKFMEANPFVIRKMSPDIFIPLLDEAGLVEDERMAKMYASLIICFSNPESFDKVHPSYPRVLGQLSKVDVQLLESMYAGIQHGGYDFHNKGFDLNTVCKLFGLTKEQAILSFQNLWRVGVCHKGTGLDAMSENMIVFTGFGWQFLTACKVIK